MNNSSVYLDVLFPSPENGTRVDTNLQRIVNGFIGCCIFVLCLITIISIFLAKTLSNKEKVCYLTIICSDTLLSCQLLLVRLLPISYTSDHPLCHFRLWNGVVLALATMFANLMVTSERFVSVVMSFRYSQKVTSKRLIIVSLFLWLLSIILSLTMFSDGFNGSTFCLYLTVGNRTGYAVLGALMCSAVFLDFSLYVCIIKVVRRHIRQIAATMVDGNVVLERGIYIKKKEFRATLTVGIITLAYGISYFPMGAYLFYYGIFSSLTTQTNTFNLMITLLLLNSIVNPVIYIWRLESCRKEMINRILCRQNNVLEIPDSSRITRNG